jgi:hypothetical protein
MPSHASYVTSRYAWIPDPEAIQHGLGMPCKKALRRCTVVLVNLVVAGLDVDDYEGS